MLDRNNNTQTYLTVRTLVLAYFNSTNFLTQVNLLIKECTNINKARGRGYGLVTTKQ